MDITTFENVISMLKEFYYEKNGLDLTIDFLELMVYELKKIRESEEYEQNRGGCTTSD